MAKIPEKMRWIYDLLLTAAILAMATVLCTQPGFNMANVTNVSIRKI